MPLKYHRYSICPNYVTCIYDGSMPIYMPHLKLLLSVMQPHSLYTDDDDDDDATVQLPIPIGPLDQVIQKPPLMNST